MRAERAKRAYRERDSAESCPPACSRGPALQVEPSAQRYVKEPERQAGAQRLPAAMRSP